MWCGRNLKKLSSRSASNKHTEIIEKLKVKTNPHYNVQLTVACLSVSFQSLLTTNEKLHVPTLPAVL